MTTCSRGPPGASGTEFEWVVTAQSAGSYKPNPHNFEVALERIGLPRERILHVAQSLFHDHVPAKALGSRRSGSIAATTDRVRGDAAGRCDAGRDVSRYGVLRGGGDRQLGLRPRGADATPGLGGRRSRDEDGHGRGPHDLLGHTAHHEPIHPSPAMGPDDDQVDRLGDGRLDDRFARDRPPR